MRVSTALSTEYVMRQFLLKFILLTILSFIKIGRICAEIVLRTLFKSHFNLNQDGPWNEDVPVAGTTHRLNPKSEKRWVVPATGTWFFKFHRLSWCWPILMRVIWCDASCRAMVWDDRGVNWFVLREVHKWGAKTSGVPHYWALTPAFQCFWAVILN